MPDSRSERDVVAVSEDNPVRVTVSLSLDAIWTESDYDLRPPKKSREAFEEDVADLLKIPEDAQTDVDAEIIYERLGDSDA